jgi:hypothetical protein
MTTEITTTETAETFSLQSFEHAQRVAKALSSSTMIPKDYQNNIPNTLVALEMAHRIGASPLMVMQNLHIIQGRPSWSSAFIIAALNASGRFTALKYKATDKSCQAYATEKATGELLEGPTVTLDMAKAEGWLTKQGSKWQTMPELMLMYRAAAFFGRLYAPEIMMGMHAVEEISDVNEAPEAVAKLNQIAAK